ncbi:MAG: hypothetical protein HYY48_01520 [Gammaproteobacteria bacterium]|nr:hypothetical protein [Gammaproteobacteria bacterium]
MRVIPLESVPLEERAHVREGAFRSRRLLTGEAGTPGNFSLQLVTTPQGYQSPRHRHNFDQVRCQIEGDFDFGPDGEMHPGSIAYFPEATHYGPQSSTGSSTTLVLQFGGASGSGYISAAQYARAAAELGKRGTFAKGVYTRIKTDDGKINQDAYEAVWEQVNGRPLVYPKPRYARPAFMEPDHFHWVPLPDRPGASCKLLGVFSEARTKLALYRIAAGGVLPLEDHSIYFVRSGTGATDGGDYAAQTTIHLAPGEAVSARARTDTELLQIGLPQL